MELMDYTNSRNVSLLKVVTIDRLIPKAFRKSEDEFMKRYLETLYLSLIGYG